MSLVSLLLIYTSPFSLSAGYLYIVFSLSSAHLNQCPQSLYWSPSPMSSVSPLVICCISVFSLSTDHLHQCPQSLDWSSAATVSSVSLLVICCTSVLRVSRDYQLYLCPQTPALLLICCTSVLSPFWSPAQVYLVSLLVISCTSVVCLSTGHL